MEHGVVRLVISRYSAKLVEECPDGLMTRDALGLLARVLVNVEDRRLLDLLSIPAGRVTTYSALSELWGVHPRSVGSILRRNPFPVVLPCHRVVDSRGFLRGYSLGVELKKRLLESEGVSIDGFRIIRLGRYFVYPNRVGTDFWEILGFLKKSLGLTD